jgi:transcriptional regulator with XRE-family HTH domain
MDRMIGEKIRELRQAQGRSLADVAGRAKISVATLSRIENDKQSLDLGLFLVLAKLLHVAPEELLNGNGGDRDEENTDPLARRIAALETKKRTELWREVAAERRTLRGRTSHGDTTQQVEEMLAQIDFLREELDRMRKRIRKR